MANLAGFLGEQGQRSAGIARIEDDALTQGPPPPCACAWLGPYIASSLNVQYWMQVPLVAPQLQAVSGDDDKVASLHVCLLPVG